MAEAQVRDDISDLITMTGYQASTLTGGQELLSRTIPAVNNVSLDSAIGSSLTYRVISSSGRTLMRSKVLMCFPLKFDNLATRDAAGMHWELVQELMMFMQLLKIGMQQAIGTSVLEKALLYQCAARSV